MSLEAWLAIAGMGITLALFGLTIIVAVIGFFLKNHMTKVEGQLSELPGIRSDLAVLVERQTNQGRDINRHQDWLADHDREIHKHAEALGVLSLGGRQQ